MTTSLFQDQLALLHGSLKLTEHGAEIVDRQRLQDNIYKLVEISALGDPSSKGAAQYLIRQAALAFGVIPSSINDLYLARGRGEIPTTFTVPAMNLRMLAFDSARAVFRIANEMNAGAFIFEIARSEMGYTDQRPAEYASNILAAAIAEGYTGPVFIQGDHFQVSAKRYTSSPETETQAVKDLTKEAIAAGFYNIDIDTSTLVDITKSTIPEQQTLNNHLSAMYSANIRSLQPEGVQISIGGEIGEVGGHNSTEEELRAYMDGYHSELTKLGPKAQGLSKISIQTGTSHGGVVLPDGTIAKVNLDFGILLKLSRLARSVYGMGGTVQHGASTLPDNAFGKFVESEAVEVHLATNFQNIIFEHIPETLRSEMYAYLDKNSASERKPDMTDEQFYYKTRKNAIGPFKSKTWNLPAEVKNAISRALEEQFRKLFVYLGMQGTRKYTDIFIHPVKVIPDLKFYLGETAVEEEVSDLAD
ncbi:MAG: aldolase [Anaerolineales bacterium]|nr:aldolase [Anaerolineae bacterium]PWB50905.1 MAG: aldolase [Anaerolineales bacterium]